MNDHPAASETRCNPMHSPSFSGDSPRRIFVGHEIKLESTWHLPSGRQLRSRPAALLYRNPQYWQRQRFCGGIVDGPETLTLGRLFQATVLFQDNYGGGMCQAIGRGGPETGAWQRYTVGHRMGTILGVPSAQSTPIPLARVRKKGASSRRRFYSKQR
jgi:hypothetical protein